MFPKISNLRKIYKNFLDIDYLNKFEDRYKDSKALYNKQKDIQYSKNRILAIYDFIDAPYTSDIGIFIINAEIERRRLNLSKIDIIFITNDTYPANQRYQSIITKDNYKHLVYNFAIEFTRLFKFIGSIIMLDNRNQAIEFIKQNKKKYYLFPKDYNITNPFERISYIKEMSFYATNYSFIGSKDRTINCLSSPNEQKRLVRKWLIKNVYPKVPITITLRETEKIDLPRNSNINAWQKLADYFSNDDRYLFVILRDYYKLYDENILVGNNVIYCNEAVVSLSFRAALHENVSLNLFIQNGVSVVSLLSNKTRYIQFKMITEQIGSTTIKHYKEYLRLNIGDNWYGATKYQKLIWEDDDFDVLKRETDAMLKVLEEDAKLYPDFYNSNYIEEEKEVTYNEEIYKRPSLISQRTPLKYYVYIFHFIKFFRNSFHFNQIKALESIQIKRDDKILLYGAGTIAKDLIPKYKDNIIGIIDKNFATLKSSEFDNIALYSPLNIIKLSFDYIVITPQLKEYSIQKELQNSFNIKKNKFLIATKYQ